MNWLAWPIIPKRLWPKIEYKPKRAIRADEHQRIIEREPNPENRSFYELCWHLGGSQTDVANLEAASIDWNDRVISYARRKTGSRRLFILVRHWKRSSVRCRPKGFYSRGSLC